MIPDIHSEDRLVQVTFADHLRDDLVHVANDSERRARHAWSSRTSASTTKPARRTIDSVATVTLSDPDPFLPPEGMTSPITRSVLVFLSLVTGWTLSSAQRAQVAFEHARYELPQYLADVISNEDRELFTRLLNINIESAWGYLRNHGYPYSFTNEVEPVADGMRLVGRARTARYLPFRQDLVDEYKEPQLNYRSAEEVQPGEVIVFDMGGDIESSPSGDVTSVRAMANGCAGIVVYGAMRDVPAFISMGLPLFTKDGKGHASGVRPRMTSWDYQTPVKVGAVTIVPGDYIVGAVHGILVIPAAMVEEVLEHAERHTLLEDFQRGLLMEGRSMIGVYPPNEETLQAFEDHLEQMAR